jgi:hypothetical protein
MENDSDNTVIWQELKDPYKWRTNATRGFVWSTDRDLETIGIPEGGRMYVFELDGQFHINFPVGTCGPCDGMTLPDDEDGFPACRPCEHRKVCRLYDTQDIKFKNLPEAKKFAEITWAEVELDRYSDPEEWLSRIADALDECRDQILDKIDTLHDRKDAACIIRNQTTKEA